MKRLLIVSLLLAFAIPLIPPTPAYSQTPVPRPDVVAFYYPWYETPQYDGQWRHWGERGNSPPLDLASDYYPLLHAYSSFDPSVVEQHMHWLLQAGINVIAVSWWGPGSPEDLRIPLILAQATRFNIKVAFLVEPYHRVKKRSVEGLADDIAYLYDRYGWSPAFYRTNQPSLHSTGVKSRQGVFFFWAPQVEYEGSPPVSTDHWRDAVDEIHALPDGGIVLAASNDPDWVTEGHFDGEWNYARPHWSDRDWKRWAWSLPAGAWFVPCVSPGFSAQRMQYPYATFVSRRSGATYNQQWRDALATGLRPQMIGIATFNEWHEGTQIEPAASEAYNGQGQFYTDYGKLGPTGYISTTVGWVEQLPTLLRMPDYRQVRTISVALGRWNESQGLMQIDLSGDGQTKALSVDNLPARQLATRNSPLRYLYLWVHNDFIFARETAVTVEVDYLDAGNGRFGLEHDSSDTDWPFEGAYKPSPPIWLSDSGEWRTATFTLPDAYFGGRQNGRADLRLFSDNSDLIVRRVKITNPAIPQQKLYLPLMEGLR